MRRRAGVDGRFIPACAGNSLRSDRSHSCVPVHPRVCGEQVFDLGDLLAHLGSSPRVRGTVGLGHHVAFDLRFIPACAGNRTRFATR